MFDTSAGSDLTLRCKDGKVFNVHKAILCAQSKYFENACKPENFKEGQESRFKLGEGTSDIVKIVLNFCYTLDTTTPISRIPCSLISKFT